MKYQSFPQQIGSSKYKSSHHAHTSLDPKAQIKLANHPQNRYDLSVIDPQQQDTMHDSKTLNQSTFLNFRQGIFKNKPEPIYDNLNGDVSSAHNFVLMSKNREDYALTKKSFVDDHYMPIPQFYDLLEYQNDNQLNLELKTYDIKQWEFSFKQALINFFITDLVQEKAVTSINLDKDAFLEYNSKRFVVRKGMKIMRNLTVSSPLIDKVKALQLKTQIDEEKLKQFLNKLNAVDSIKFNDKLDHLKVKYAKIVRNSLTDKEYDKIIEKLESIRKNSSTGTPLPKELALKDESTRQSTDFIFPEQVLANQEFKEYLMSKHSWIYLVNINEFKQINSEVLGQMRQQTDLKIISIKFHFRMLRIYLLNLCIRQKHMRSQEEYVLRDELQKIKHELEKDKIKAEQKHQSKNESEKGKSLQIQSQQTQEAKKPEKKQKPILSKQHQNLIDKIETIKDTIKLLASDIQLIIEHQSVIAQLIKFLHQRKQDLKFDLKNLFQIHQTLHKTATYFEAIVVMKIKQLQREEPLNVNYFEDCIEFLMDQDDFLRLVQIFGEIMTEIQKKKLIKTSEYANHIEQNLPEIKLILSYRNETSFILDYVLKEYNQFFLDPKSYDFGVLNKTQISYKMKWEKYVQKIFHHLALYNYVACSYRFIKKQPFNLNYFSVLEQITSSNSTKYEELKNTCKQQRVTPLLLEKIDDKNFTQICEQKGFKPSNQIISKHREFQSISKAYFIIEKSKTFQKLQFFWRTYEKPVLLQRIYESGTLSLKQISHIRKSNQFNLQTIYNFHVNISEIVEYKLKYLAHYQQFYLEIVSDLSAAQNLSLGVTFNVFRFLILNYLGFFFIHTLKRIQKEIKEKNGQFYFNVFKDQCKGSKRILENEEKIQTAIKLSTQKIRGYLDALKKKEQEQSTNVKKLGKIFKEHQDMKLLFQKLNTKERIQNLFQTEYNFTEAKQCYINVMTLLFKEYLNKNILDRIFKKISKVDSEDIKLIKENADQGNLKKDCTKFVQKNPISLEFFLKDKGFNSNQCYQVFFQKFVVAFFEMSKLSSMIFALPYYSYENQMEYIRKKKLSKELNKKSQPQRDKIFYRVDELFIKQRSRINSEYLKKSSKNFQLIRIFHSYIKDSNELMDFMYLKGSDDFSQKNDWLKRDTKKPDLQMQAFKYPKPLHHDMLSVFSVLELEDFFYNFHQGSIQDKISKLEKPYRLMFIDFKRMSKEMEKRSGEITANLIKVEKQSIKKQQFLEVNKPKAEKKEIQPVKEESQEQHSGPSELVQEDNSIKGKGKKSSQSKKSKGQSSGLKITQGMPNVSYYQKETEGK